MKKIFPILAIILLAVGCKPDPTPEPQNTVMTGRLENKNIWSEIPPEDPITFTYRIPANEEPLLTLPVEIISLRLRKCDGSMYGDSTWSTFTGKIWVERQGVVLFETDDNLYHWFYELTIGK